MPAFFLLSIISSVSLLAQIINYRWQHANEGLHRTNDMDVTQRTLILRGTPTGSVGVAPDGTLWAGIMRSTDGGITWERFDRGISNVRVARVVCAPWGDAYALAATEALPTDDGWERTYALYRSTDDGETWTFLRDVLSDDLLAADFHGNLYVNHSSVSWWPDGSGHFYSMRSSTVSQSSDRGLKWTDGSRQAPRAVRCAGPSRRHVPAGDERSGRHALDQTSASISECFSFVFTLCSLCLGGELP